MFFSNTEGIQRYEANYMAKGKSMRRLEKRDAFWRGVKACMQWIGGALLGGAMFLYYLLEVIDKFR